MAEQVAVHRCYISNTGELKCCYLKIVDLLQPNSSAQLGLETCSCISANAQTITDCVCGFMTEAKLENLNFEALERMVLLLRLGARMGLLHALRPLYHLQ